MSRAVSTKNTSWFCISRSWVSASRSPSSSLAPGTPKSLTPTPRVVSRSGRLGTVSLEKRTQAVSPSGRCRANSRNPTRSSSGRSARTVRVPRAVPCGLRKTGRSTGSCPRAMRSPWDRSTNMSFNAAPGSDEQSGTDWSSFSEGPEDEEAEMTAMARSPAMWRCTGMRTGTHRARGAMYRRAPSVQLSMLTNKRAPRDRRAGRSRARGGGRGAVMRRRPGRVPSSRTSPGTPPDWTVGPRRRTPPNAAERGWSRRSPSPPARTGWR